MDFHSGDHPAHIDHHMAFTAGDLLTTDLAVIVSNACYFDLLAVEHRCTTGDQGLFLAGWSTGKAMWITSQMPSNRYGWK